MDSMYGATKPQRMKSFNRDFAWQAKMLPQVKAILGMTFICDAPFEEDVKRNTDLMVLTMEPLRFACRLRNHGYYERYRFDITIRNSRPSGAQTELEKLLNGYGDYMFYGFANDDRTKLVSYTIGDLKVFREWYKDKLKSGVQPGQKKCNPDGSSDFLAFNLIKELPAEFIVCNEQSGE